MIDKIYIVHFEPLTERKEYLDSILPSFNIPYEYYVSNNDTDQKILDNIDTHYKYDASILNRKLTKGEISVASSHVKIYKDILKKNYNFCLIIEDDAIFLDNFLESLENVMIESLEFDLIFLSSCCNLRKFKNSNKFLYESDLSRCVTGYIVNSKNLHKIIEYSSPISTAIDTNYNIIKNKLGLKYAWCEPPIINQGSENKYKSNLR
jgi:glycosyl transferase family 25